LDLPSILKLSRAVLANGSPVYIPTKLGKIGGGVDQASVFLIMV